MVIGFANDTAFSQLDEHGFVATFRESRRARPNCETWCNRGRGKEKEFDVRVIELGETTPNGDKITQYRPLSGFQSEDDWRNAMADLNDELPESGWLYLVTKQ